MIKIPARQNNSITNHTLHGLDHLRAFAITIVFLYHYGRLFIHPEWVNLISKFGWTGVDLFFVLSGYLIASHLFKEIERYNTISFKTFFIKRFFRIIPAYLIVVAIYFFLPFVREREALAPAWKYLTFTQNLGLDLRTQGTFSQAWSLCIEEQFYVILPLALFALISLNSIKWGAWLLIILFLSGFLVRLYCYDHLVLPFIDDEAVWRRWYTAIYYPTYCRLDGLLTGVGLAAACQYFPIVMKRIMKWGNLILLPGICILTVAYFLCLDERSFEASVFGFPLVSIGYGLLVMGAISPSGFLYKVSSRITTTIASLSYGIYLTHKFIIHITQQQLEKFNIAGDSNGMFLLCIIACLLAAFLLNKIIEKPFLKIRDRFLKVRKEPIYSIEKQ
ncbi:MAG: acyltransferase [Ferruginibacter sp.]